MALGVFVAVAVTIGFYVDRSAARSREALRARAEAEVLARTTATLLGEPDPIVQLIDQIRGTFSFGSVSLLSRAADTWTLIASSGDTPPLTPFDDATWDLTVGPETVFVVKGGTVQADDERLLRTFVSQLAIALDSRRLQARAVAAESLADADALRTALLRAVSHDLRTPLASVKASVTSLHAADVSWADAERQVFLATIDTETDRLNGWSGTCST